MATAIREGLPSAIALVIAAAPILALVLLLVTSRPLSVSLLFLLGWIGGILTAAALIAVFVDVSVPRDASGGMTTAGAFVRILLGIVLGTLAIRAWRRRASAGTPKWMTGVTGASPIRAGAIGYLLGSLNPKNLAVVAVGTTSILVATSVPHEQAVAILVFAVVASLGVAIPIALQAFGGPGARRSLQRGAEWMKVHGKTISILVLGVLALVVFTKGVGGLLAS